MSTASRCIVQLSDTHLVAAGQLVPGVTPLANLERALDRLADHGARPDAVLLTGDLADRGEPEAYAALRALLERHPALATSTVVVLAGNHDDRGALCTHLLGEPASTDPLYRVSWVGDLRIVALDSTVPGAAHGALGEDQLDALRRELAQSAPAGTIVAVHHPPVPSPLPTMNGYGLRAPERLAEVLLGSDVCLVVAGHDHHASAGALAGIPVFVGPSTAYSLDPLATTGGLAGLVKLDQCAFARIDVADHRAVATVVPVAGSAAPL